MGSGITASNITYSGDSLARGEFNDPGSNIGFSGGVLLCTGAIQNAIGPNNIGSLSYSFGTTSADPDLNTISTSPSIFDAAILEFDFTPISDTLTFRFAFASEEYVEWVNASFNDVFGFFISGPDPSGGNYSSKNIALIPGTNTPVAIDNVNLGLNSSYYIDNGNGTGTGTSPDGAAIQYDGYTVPITVKVPVVSGKTYHLKIAIADIGDAGYDSGVFLEASSFSSSPSATLTGTVTACENGVAPAITFKGKGGKAPYQFTYSLNNGNPQIINSVGNTITLPAPTTTSGIQNYKLISAIDAASKVCFVTSDSMAIVTILPLPKANIRGTTTVDQNTSSSVTFIGSNGTPPYTFTYTLDGGPNQLISTTVNDSVSLNLPNNVIGVFTYSLVSVRDSSPLGCSQLQSNSAIVTVVLSTKAKVDGTSTVCQHDAFPNITFTGPNVSSTYTFTYTVNGGANQTISTSVGNAVTVPVSTASTGIYKYTLLGAIEGGLKPILISADSVAIVTVKQLPTATVTGTATVYQNAPAQVTFAGSNGAAPYKFVYSINGATSQTITTTAGNNVNLAVPTGSIGVFKYKLLSVSDANPVSCSQIQLDSAIVTVIPVPTASVTGNAVLCQKSTPLPRITFTGINGVQPYTFTYKVNGGANNQITTSFGDTVSVAVSSQLAGAFTYSLVSAVAGNSVACNITTNSSALVTVNPLPTASLSGASTTCLNATEEITFTGIGSSAPYTFNYTLDGGSIQSITSAGSTAKVTVPTNITKTYTYILTNVIDAGTTTCSQNQTDTVIITVNAPPKASISSNIDVCKGGPAPFITFKGSNGVAPYVITYNINGGQNMTATTAQGDSVTILESSKVPGNITYSMVSVTDANPTACVSLQTAQATISVHPNPEAAFVAQPQKTTLFDSDIKIIDASIGADSLFWIFGDGTTLFSAASEKQFHTYADTGTFKITMVATSPYNCFDSTYHMVRIVLPFTFYIPNAFSPNDDKVNDTFTAKGNGFLKFNMMIFDRWGNFIFSSDDINKPWDGKVQGHPEICELDTYVYVFNIIDIEKHEHTFRGTVSLVQ